MCKTKKIEQWFLDKLERAERYHSSPVGRRGLEEIFNDVYEPYILFEYFGLLNKKTKDYFNEICKLVFSLNYNEIYLLLNKKSFQNVHKLIQRSDYVPLTEKEEKIYAYWELMTTSNRNFSSKSKILNDSIDL